MYTTELVWGTAYMENLSGSDVFEAIRERAEALWNDALRRAARGSASTKASLFHVVFSVAYMLGLDGQLVGAYEGPSAWKCNFRACHA